MKSAKKPMRKNKPTENVEVFCRIRPIDAPTCIKKLSNTTLAMTNFDNRSGTITRETRYSFQNVFDEASKQEEVFDRIAYPLVDNLLHGKNGLLFAYGVTSSGKTHTMQGVGGDRGVLHRCLDTLFNSIRLSQAKKYVFKADKMNGFDVQTDADAFLERQAREITPRMLGHKHSRLSTSTPNINTGETLSPKISDIDTDSFYSVFVTYVEIYNNYVYDLLEETPLEFVSGNKSPTSKNIREDSDRRMYVSGVVECEVTTAEEAVELFLKGQVRRKVASTALNTESSRSHSVFTLRLVRGPLDARGEAVIQDKRKLVVSELSLVDLAGSERTARTGSNGDRLKEAGNINQSLMVLRTCIEVLRENQKNSTSRHPPRQLVPYRDSKITLLFRSYFEGEGKVSMVVCVNPKMAEYDETMYVMKFAELAQEVQITKALVPKLDLGLTPGRRQANLQNRDLNRDLNRATFDDITNKVYTPFPFHLCKGSTDERSADDLLRHLRDRLTIKTSLQDQLDLKQASFRERLVEMDGGLNEGREGLQKTQRQLKETLNQLEEVKKKGQEKDQQMDSLVAKLRIFELERQEFEKEMGEKNWAILQEKLKNNRLRQDYNAKLDLNAKQYNQNIEQARRKMKDEAVLKLRGKQQKLDLVKSIINDSNPPTPVPDTPRRGYTRTNDCNLFKLPTNPPSTTKKRTKSPPPVKPKPYTTSRRRSKSTENLWLEHRPNPIDQTSSILQPKLRGLRSVAKITEKELKTTDANKYLLSHQGYDSQGELVTKFHKGDIMTSATGGTSVVFNDVEVVKSKIPGSTKRRSDTPPPSDGQWTDVETRCQVALDGHAINKKFKCSEL